MVKTSWFIFQKKKTFVPFCLRKKNRTQKQTMSPKITISWLFSDVWCHLFVACFHWKDSVFQQIVVRIYYILNIFSCRTSIISYKMEIIAGISNETNKKWINKICSFILKRHDILPIRTNFFISTANKIENVQEIKIKLFE